MHTSVPRTWESRDARRVGVDLPFAPWRFVISISSFFSLCSSFLGDINDWAADQDRPYSVTIEIIITKDPLRTLSSSILTATGNLFPLLSSAGFSEYFP